MKSHYLQSPIFAVLAAISLSLLSLNSLSAQEELERRFDFNIFLRLPIDEVVDTMDQEPAPKDLTFISSASSETTTVYWNATSRLLRYQGSENFTLYEGAGESRRALASVKIPADGKHFVMLVISNGKDLWRIMPIDVSKDKMPLGTALFHNFSGEAIALQIANKNYQLENRASVSVPLDKVVNYQLRVKVAAFIRERWRVVSKYSFVANNDSRLLLIFYQTGAPTKNWDIININSFEPSPQAVEAEDENPNPTE